MKPFTYDAVQLTSGPLYDQLQYTITYYMNIPNDDLLKSYRERAGLKSEGEDMGGWYDWKIQPGGHLIGHMISGFSRIYYARKDQELKNKIDALVSGFGETLDDTGFFLNHYLQNGESADYYVYDKLAIGMLDAARYAGNTQALAILSKMTDWMIQNIDENNLGDEWYTLPENLYEAWEYMHDEKYRNLADRLIYHHWYCALSCNENVLPGKHAYSHVNALCSAARLYINKGEKIYLDAMQNAYNMILKEQLYASGGYGPGEAFIQPGSDGLWEALFGQHNGNKFNSNKNHEATCNSYALLKLCRYMAELTQDTRYGDLMERVIFNTLLGTLRPVGRGLTHYYDSYRPGALKTYFSEQNNETWPCCSGTYLQVMADYSKNIFFQHDSGIHVNLFVNAVLQWECKGQRIQVSQNTNFPYEGKVTLTIETTEPVLFELTVRKPDWLKEMPQVSINGEIQMNIAASDTAWMLERTWKNGDCISFDMPMSLSLQPINSLQQDICAVMYGPVLLVGKTYSDAIPMNAQDFLKQLVPIPGHPLCFACTSLTPGLMFVPYHSIQDQTTYYTTYFRLNCKYPDPVLLDDIHPAWIFSNGWQRNYQREFGYPIVINDFTHVTFKNDASARITFDGTGIRVISSMSDKHSAVGIKVDGLQEEMVSEYSDIPLQRQVIWSSEELHPGTHTIVIRARINQQKEGDSAYAELDAVEINPIPYADISKK